MNSGGVPIEPVHTRKQQRQFMQFAWDHYRGDPNWVPPLRTNQRELLGYKRHPFYEKNVCQTFLAKQNGKVVGRIAAIIDRGHNERYDEKRGMFGFFESIDDQQVANSLFDAASEWFRSQGMTCIRGPNNPSLNNECALLVEGFDLPPTFMMPYNKPYYGELIENYGFEKSQDMYAFWGHLGMLQDASERLKFVIEQTMERFDMTIRSINKRRMVEDVESFMHIYNKALAGQWGFVPLTDAEVKHVGESLKYLIVPECTTIIEIDKKPVAAAFGIPDYNPIIKKIDGRLFPFGFLSLLFGRKQIKKVRLVGTYVSPEYQKWGLGIMLMARMVPDCLAWGFEEAEFSWVLESNKLSRGTLERGGAVRQKTYRMYDKEIE